MADQIFPTDFPTASAVAQTDVVLLDDGTTNRKAAASLLPVNLVFRDEGTDVAAQGEIGIIDLVGAGVTATKTGNKITVTIPGGSGPTLGDTVATIDGTGAAGSSSEVSRKDHKHAIGSRAVTVAHLPAVASARLLGRATAGSGDQEELAADTGLKVAAGKLSLDLQALGEITPNPFAVSVAVHDGANNGDLPLWKLLMAYRNRVLIEDDFDNTTDGYRGFNSTTSGGTTSTGTGEQNHPGIVTLSTSSSATGRAVIHTAVTAYRLGGGVAKVAVIFKTPGALSDGTETYTIRLGLGDSVSAEHTDGAFLRYTHSANSGKFEFVTRANDTETATDTGVTVAASTWYRLEIDINAAGTSASCTIDGTAAGTNTTNIPTAAGRELGFIPGSIIKSAGTSARTLSLDYAGMLLAFTTAR